MTASNGSDRAIGRVKIVRVDGEYIVRAWDTAGVRFPDADYYTNDRADAVGTARLMLNPPARPDADA